MKITEYNADGIKADVITVNTLIIGTGAAGYNAACTLKRLGVDDIAVVTEGVNTGTSRNTGSDKQTYYKLNLCAGFDDSPAAMAADLFAGKCVDGDVALCEAANSVRCFLSLCNLGVAFPVNRYGEYVGYKTDHDTRARATSAGPLTSKMMTECLQREAARQDVRVFDKMQVIEIIKDGEKAAGTLCLNLSAAGRESRFTLFCAGSIIMCTGGPAGIYSDTVYPAGHAGSSGVAFLAGARGQNLTEWQYGLASTAPRWNVSGTYMQVLPRFVSVDNNGTQREFLMDYYKDTSRCLSMVFRKGYEWPFDSRKALDGSSVIDLLVYRETALYGRKVFLDFRTNPAGLSDLPYEKLDSEAYEYLKNASALFGTPIERLEHMNAPAVELYAAKGVDLKTKLLPIALCAQHSNGGIAVDMWWRTSVKSLFAAGECAGTHGVYRPGGSALNAGQVGSLRAATYISEKGEKPENSEKFLAVAAPYVKKNTLLCERALCSKKDCRGLLEETRRSMSECAGAIRDPEKIKELLQKVLQLLERFEGNAGVPDASQLWKMYRLRDTLAAQYVYLSAMSFYSENGGFSRGSALYSDKNGEKPENTEELFRYVKDTGALDGVTQESYIENGSVVSLFRDVRPLPEGGGFFENVWRDYRENRNVF